MRRRPVTLLVAACAIAACGDDSPAGDAERFCTEIATHQAALTAPDLSNSDQIGPLVELYRSVGEFAPLSIEEEWDQLTLNVETASTVIPGDDASEQAVIAEALRTEKSAVAVADWVRTNCELDLGPVATVAPQG